MYKPVPSPALDYLKQFPHWICQGADKVPINPNTGYKAKPNDSNTWATFEQCSKYWLRNRNKIDDLLMCFVITKETGIIGIDLDDDPNPVFFDTEITKWAGDIVKSINSYSELSRSNTGIHILAFGEIERSLGHKKTHGVEIYNHNKIWTITGRHLPFTPNTIEKRPDEILALHKQYAPHIYEPQPIRNYQYSDDMPSTSQIADMLASIPLPIGYEDWLNICMAVHSAYPNEDGFHLVLNWSSGHFKEGENEVLAMRNKWRSFNGNGIGIGTLFHFAKQYGWLPPSNTPINEPLNPAKSVDTPSNPEIVVITQDELDKRLDSEYWRGYHDGMTDIQRQSWLTTGIPNTALDFVIDNLGLGFRPESVDYDTGEINTDCLSIPYFIGDDTANIEYRCLSNGLVTYEIQKPTIYNTSNETPCNHVCILDDSIDSIKAWLHFGHMEIGGDRLHFLALPKTKIDSSSLQLLKDANYIYVIIGKDSNVHGRGLTILKNDARFIRLPMSITDTCHHVTDKEFISLLRSGEKM